jgi:hypothetical protein
MIVEDLIRLLMKCPPGARVRHYPDRAVLNPFDIDAVWLGDDDRVVVLDQYPPTIGERGVGLRRVE